MIVAPLTTAFRGLSLHIEVEADPDNGLDDTSYIQCELVRSVDRRRLPRRLGTAAPDVVEQACHTARILLSM